MQTGFRNLPVDTAFAQRSAQYLASQGYRPGQIRSALVEQLELSEPFADEVLADIAA